MKDLVGRDMTPVETKVLRLYRSLCALLREEGANLAPTTTANLREAAAALWVLVNELGLSTDRPDDLRL